MFKRIFKTIFIFGICFGLVTTAHASPVAVSDGSAFITKSEFKSLVNEASSRIEALELHADTQIDIIVASFLARNNIWHPQKQTLTSYTTMVLAPYFITISNYGASGTAQINDRRVLIDEVTKSGLMVLSLYYVCASPSSDANTFKWGYMGSMKNNGCWTSDNGTELTINFYEQTKKSDGTYDAAENKYVCLIGTAQGAKASGGNSDTGYICSFPVSPFEVLIPAYFFVSKRSRVLWDATQLYKFALTNTCQRVRLTENSGQDIRVWISDPIVY